MLSAAMIGMMIAHTGVAVFILGVTLVRGEGRGVTLTEAVKDVFSPPTGTRRSWAALRTRP